MKSREDSEARLKEALEAYRSAAHAEADSYFDERALETQRGRILAEGRYPFHKLHTHTVGLDEVERAIRILGGEVEGEQVIHITVVP